MSSDTPEIRDQLNTAWEAVGERLVKSGYSRSAVVETMAANALRALDELYGMQDATHFILKTRSRLRREPDGLGDASPLPSSLSERPYRQARGG